MAPRRSAVVEPLDAFSEVENEAMERAADTYAEALAELDSVTDQGAKLIVFKVKPNGKWGICREYLPPLDTSMITDEIKQEFGAGDYMFRLMVNKKIKTTKPVSIEVPNSAKQNAPAPANGLGTDMLQMLMSQQRDAQAQMQSMFGMMIAQQQQAQQAAEARAASNTQSMIALAGIVAPLILGNKDTPASMIGAIAPLLKKEDGLKEMLAVMASAKELFSGNNDGGGDDGFIGGAIKALAPTLAGALAGPMGAPMGAPVQAPQAQAPRALPSGPTPPMIQDAPSPIDALVNVLGSRMMTFAEDDIDVELAGDYLIETLTRKGITFDALQALATQFAAMGDYFQYLKSRGFDFTGREEWFVAVIGYVAENYPTDTGNSDNSERTSGGSGDAQENAGTSD